MKESLSLSLNLSISTRYQVSLTGYQGKERTGPLLIVFPYAFFNTTCCRLSSHDYDRQQFQYLSALQEIADMDRWELGKTKKRKTVPTRGSHDDRKNNKLKRQHQENEFFLSVSLYIHADTSL